MRSPVRIGPAWGATLLVALFVLAGCAGRPQDVDVAGPIVSFNRTLGAISGIVTNDEIIPLTGANVTVAGLGSTYADEGGRFAFSNVEPGEYEVTARAVLHMPASIRVEVHPDEVATVRFELSKVALDERQVLFKSFSGELTVGTPLNIAGTQYGLQEGVDRKTFKFQVVDKLDGQVALCTALEIRLKSFTVTAVDLDMYLLNEKGGPMSSSASNQANELINYQHNLAAQNVTIIVHFWAGVQAQFGVYVNASYATGAAAQLALNERD